jgi:preprotein translocase subunit SecE
VAKSRSTNRAAAAEAKEPNVVMRYINDTRAELGRVTWPTREETQNLTLVIVTVTVAMAIFLGTLDYLFQIVVAGIIVGNLFRIGLGIVLFLGGIAAFYFNSQE